VLSKELLEKEELFRKRNEELSAQAKEVLHSFETVVKTGQDKIMRPKTAPSIDTEEKVPRRAIRKPQRKSSVTEGGSVDVLMGLGATTEEHIGGEAVSRFLKAKTHVLQKELEKVIVEKKSRVQNVDKDNELVALQERIKELEADRGKEQKETAFISSQSEKLKHLNADLMRKVEEYKIEIAKLKKELESFTRSSKQVDQEVQQKDLRLNRALEEIEKLKQQLSVKDLQYKETLEQCKRDTNELFAENKRLQKQKQDLLSGFRKQNQLIEILKRQKVCSGNTDAHRGNTLASIHRGRIHEGTPAGISIIFQL
jgi:methyl-accepting chemotaxis protein